MAPVVGRYFGNNGQQLDEYGANLAAANLPGRGHRATHNLLQSILCAMMKLGGIFLVKEAANFLLDKIGEPYITRYVNHVSSFPNARRAQWSIVPDIHAHNFPAGRQTINDSGASFQRVKLSLRLKLILPAEADMHTTTLQLALLIVELKKLLMNTEGSSRS